MEIMNNVILQTTIPIVLLIGTGFISRRLGILRTGDERVLSAYIYYFALPALFFVNMAETSLTMEMIEFVLAGVIPIFMALVVLISITRLLRLSRDTLFLLILSTIFGSLAFFGIPFITFAFPGEGERIATLAAASISIVSVTISITTLELYQLERSDPWSRLKLVGRRLSKNPLIISICLGILASISQITIPDPVSRPLHMLGGTTSAVAIFMLGVFLYGRRYSNLLKALKLSLLRMTFLPSVAFLITFLFSLSPIERSALTLMHGMPLAISMIILSERYNFHKETIASLILISSLTAGLYLNLWILFLGPV